MNENADVGDHNAPPSVYGFHQFTRVRKEKLLTLVPDLIGLT